MSAHDNTPHAWEVRDGMLADYVAKLAVARTHEAADFIASNALTLIALAVEAGQSARVTRWATDLAVARKAAQDRIFATGGAA